MSRLLWHYLMRRHYLMKRNCPLRRHYLMMYLRGQRTRERIVWTPMGYPNTVLNPLITYGITLSWAWEPIDHLHVFELTAVLPGCYAGCICRYAFALTDLCRRVDRAICMYWQHLP